MPDFTHMNSAEDDERYNNVHALNERRKGPVEW